MDFLWLVLDTGSISVSKRESVSFPKVSRIHPLPTVLGVRIYLGICITYTWLLIFLMRLNGPRNGQSLNHLHDTIFFYPPGIEAGSPAYKASAVTTTKSELTF
jgi:hypothetical protein